MILRDLTPQLLVSDWARSIEFYTGVLGFTLDGLWPQDKPDWCMLDHGNVHIMCTTEAHEGPPHFTGKLALHTDDVMAVFERVNGRAKLVYGPEVYHYGMKEFAIEDPDGYMLSFSQPTDEPPTCTE